MGNKIIVCGLNGAGKSTLGRCLAEKLNYQFLDIEDYYFLEKNVYENARTREEVGFALLADMKKYENCVLGSGKGNYGAEVEALFTHAVYINVPKELRMKRVRSRSFEKFGSRMLEGGDLYEKEESFFKMAERRTERDVEDWLETLCIPVITVDGTKPIAYNVEAVSQKLQSENKWS